MLYNVDIIKKDIVYINIRVNESVADNVYKQMMGEVKSLKCSSKEKSKKKSKETNTFPFSSPDKDYKQKLYEDDKGYYPPMRGNASKKLSLEEFKQNLKQVADDYK